MLFSILLHLDPMLFSNKYLATEQLNITFLLKFFNTKLETYGSRLALNNQTNRLRVITKATFNSQQRQQQF